MHATTKGTQRGITSILKSTDGHMSQIAVSHKLLVIHPRIPQRPPKRQRRALNSYNPPRAQNMHKTLHTKTLILTAREHHAKSARQYLSHERIKRVSHQKTFTGQHRTLTAQRTEQQYRHPFTIHRNNMYCKNASRCSPFNWLTSTCYQFALKTLEEKQRAHACC